MILETTGVTYQLDGQTYTNQHHFDFSPLIDALQFYASHIDGWFATQNWAEISYYWDQIVGRAQRYIPAHVAQEFCHPTRSFHPTHSFTEPDLPRSLIFYNHKKTTIMSWWHLTEDSSLTTTYINFDFGISRGAWVQSAGHSPWDQSSGPITLATLLHFTVESAALYKVRTADLK